MRLHKSCTHTHTFWKACLNRETLPASRCPCHKGNARGGESAVNAKRMLANISPLFFPLTSFLFPLSITPDHLLPAVIACGGEETWYCKSLISLYRPLKNKLLCSCRALTLLYPVKDKIFQDAAVFDLKGHHCSEWGTQRVESWFKRGSGNGGGNRSIS